MATSSVPKGKYLNEENLAICAKLDSDDWVDISTLIPIIADIRVKYNVQETKKSLDNFEDMDLDSQIKYFKNNHLKQLQNALRKSKKAGLIDNKKKSIESNGDKVKGYKGLLDDYMLRLRNEWISKEGIEIVRGNLNFSILSQIQGWITDQMDQGEDVPSYFISIEDSVGNHSSDEGKLTLEQKHLSRLSYSIIYKKAVKITYLPNALGGKQTDELIFSPEYLRRVGRKWMVYGMSESKQFPQPAYVNLVLSRIKHIGDSDTPYTPSGVDYKTDDPFKDQMTYHGFPACSGKNEKVVIKVRKEKSGYTSGTKIYPFVRIQQEPLHYSQTVIDEDSDYGYIKIEVSDAMFIRPILLTWGADIEVIDPSALREQMRQEVATMQAMYAQKASR